MVEAELRREEDGLEVPRKDGMTARRAWAWDLREMREAAMMDEPILDEPPDNPHPAPTIFGFTAINHPGYSGPVPSHPEPEDAATKSKSADKARGPKKRKTQSSAATTAAKPKKAACSKKTRKAKTAVQLDSQDISKGLSRTKPTSSGDGALPVKAGLSLEENPLTHGLGLQRIGDASAGLEVKPAAILRKKQGKSSELADKYLAAYANVRANVVNQPTPPTPPRSNELDAEPSLNDQSYGLVSAIKRQVSPNFDLETSIQGIPESDGSIIVRDFGAPPFTQTSPPTLQGRDCQGAMTVDELEPLDSMADDLFEIDDLKSGHHGGEDEFPMNDECLEEMMQSMAVPAEEELLGPDWRPQDFSDDTLYINEQLNNDQPHWPGAVPDSDGVVVYNENPTLVATDIIDVPSSPQLSSQASCILTHVKRIVNPDRARTSEGSENCFDDNDLDDGLLDLMVDECKSLQATSPVTPAKRLSSPKLQWLSPRTYTPAKSSRTPVSPAKDPYLVPENFNGDALPFVRPPFPKAIRDRSPILGLTNRTVLRTSFRIGEALNAATVASRTNIDVITEVYARVVSSSREASGGYKQSFQFGDLFTDKPPYLSATYTFWKGVGLWDHDSKGLIGEYGRGKMARVLGRIKKKGPEEGKGPGVEMAVLSIWEVDWKDVDVAKGIACPEAV